MNLPKIFSVFVAMIMLSTSATVSAEVTITAETKQVIRIVKKSVEDYVSAAQGDYTGLIIDCRGLGLQTAMSPVIKNANGTKIYGHKDLDIDKIIAMGMVDYVSDPGKIERAGVNPLVIKAVSLDNFNSDPVVSLVDSNKILIENYVSKFLQGLKVVFLYD